MVGSKMIMTFTVLVLGDQKVAALPLICKRMERTKGIEPSSTRWQREALPLSYGRVVGGRGIEPRMRIGAGFTDPLSHQTWRHPIGCSGPNRTACLVGMSHASCQCSTLRQRLRGLNSLACAAVHPCVRRIGGQPRS